VNLTRLTYCSPQKNIKIIEFCGGVGAKENLKSFGLNIGDYVALKPRKNGHGKFILELNNREIGIGHELASKVLIETDKEETITLDKVKIGDVVEVTKMGAKGDVRFRLLDMGLVKGVQLKIIRVAPLGDPIEVVINEFNLSLRLDEAKNIEVKIIEIDKLQQKIRKKWGLFR
jgi:ferrous iron transport protein A